MFLRHVEGLLQQAEQVEREAAALAAETAGEIRLGVFWTPSPFYAAGLIRSFYEILPDIVVRHQEMSLVSLVDTLRDGTIDFALTYERGAELTDMVLIELAAPRPMVVLAADHPLARRDSVNLHDLAHEPYVMLDGLGSRSYFEDLLAERGISPQISYVSTSMEAVRSAVASGFGFTLLVMQPPSAMTSDRREIRTLRIENDIRPPRIVLASRGGMHRGPITRRFADHAVRYFASLGEGGR